MKLTIHLLRKRRTTPLLSLLVVTEGAKKTLFLGAFAKLRKATIIFIMSVYPSVRMELLCSHSADFHEI